MARKKQTTAAEFKPVDIEAGLLVEDRRHLLPERPNRVPSIHVVLPLLLPLASRPRRRRELPRHRRPQYPNASTPARPFPEQRRHPVPPTASHQRRRDPRCRSEIGEEEHDGHRRRQRDRIRRRWMCREGPSQIRAATAAAAARGGGGSVAWRRE